MDALPVLPPEAEALGISFDGRVYHYGEYSYDHLADALRYGRLERTRSAAGEAPVPRQWKQWPEPTPEERLQMDKHGIVFEYGYYRYGAYRYDLLSAALDYAHREPGLSLPVA